MIPQNLKQTVKGAARKGRKLTTKLSAALNAARDAFEHGRHHTGPVGATPLEIKVPANQPLPKTKSPDGKVRLNLGCGDKILENYVNVDIAPARNGLVPDYLSDVRQLTLPDNFADEILSVHVIEHFYYWEAEALLREWLRVLKPGGKMILECPNLESAARALLEAPDLAAGPGKEGQSTMWVFYGDPSWKDALMCHRWGYTPKSLKALMEKVGLVQVQQEPAAFKKREPRDMRVTGLKRG